MNFYPKLEETIRSLDLDKISTDRKKNLQLIINYIQKKYDQKSQINLNFICTHNSRRSQLTQVWAKAISKYYGIEIYSYSGGVEITEFNINAVNSLINSGFKIDNEEGTSPKYSVSFSEKEKPIIAYSKLFDDETNPKKNFLAIMTCSHADENCPMIFGAEDRIPLRYDDPKLYDNTPLQEQKYLERSNEIATELSYIFSKITK